jgi:hypothetical protein
MRARLLQADHLRVGRVCVIAPTGVFYRRDEIAEDAPKKDFFGKPHSERAQLILTKILQH